MSLIVVLGATGAQGGSVVRELLQSPKWKIRAITRDAEGDAARKLKSQGVEVVAGDVNDKASLAKAFEGAEGIFAVTSYWPSIPTLGRDGAGEEEVEQLKNIANAADKTPTLKHLVLSALPPCSKMSGGQFPVPHFDYKQVAVDWIKANLPDLWAKTTEFWPGWYTSNLVKFATMKFMPVPGSGAYVLMLPTHANAILPIAGDLETNAGIVIGSIFAHGASTFGRVAILITDYLPYTEVISHFEKATGKRAAFAEISDENICKLWSDWGTETAAQLRWSEKYPDWHKFVDQGKIISLEELGVKDRVVGFETALAGIKEQLI